MQLFNMIFFITSEGDIFDVLNESHPSMMKPMPLPLKHVRLNADVMGFITPLHLHHLHHLHHNILTILLGG